MLARYIRDLLYRNESVIIPNMGAIRTESVSARIDEERNVFYPPSKKLTFDTSTTQSDGLLANYIAKVDNMSLESAENYVNFQVEEWKEKLQNNDLTLDGIGVFSTNDLGTIQFAADENSNYLIESFGMSELGVPEVTRTEAENKHHFEVESKKQPIKKNTTKKANKKEKSNGVLYALLFIILAAFGWFFVNQIIENNQMSKDMDENLRQQEILYKNTLNGSVIEINETLPHLTFRYVYNAALDSILPVENNIDTTGFKTKLPVENASVVSTTPAKPNNTTNSTPTENLKTPTENKNRISENARQFWVIEGVYKNSSNAINRIAELRKSGYPQAILAPKEGEFNYVTYGSYPTLQQAETELVKIKKINPESWILGK